MPDLTERLIAIIILIFLLYAFIGFTGANLYSPVVIALVIVTFGLAFLLLRPSTYGGE